MIQSILFNSQSESTNKTTYVYDKKGQKIEETRYEADGDLQSKKIYTYDDNGNMYSQHNYGYTGALSQATINEYTYDKKGNWTVDIVWVNSKPSGYIERQISYY